MCWGEETWPRNYVSFITERFILSFECEPALCDMSSYNVISEARNVRPQHTFPLAKSQRKRPYSTAAVCPPFLCMMFASVNNLVLICVTALISYWLALLDFLWD